MLSNTTEFALISLVFSRMRCFKSPALCTDLTKIEFLMYDERKKLQGAKSHDEEGL